MGVRQLFEGFIDCSRRPVRRDFNALSLFLQPESSIFGLDGVHLRSMPQMPRFTFEASWRISIQQPMCAAEFRPVHEEGAENGLCERCAARTLSHATRALSYA